MGDDGIGLGFAGRRFIAGDVGGGFILGGEQWGVLDGGIRRADSGEFVKHGIVVDTADRSPDDAPR